MIKNKYRAILPVVITIGLISVSTASIFIKLAQEEAPSIVIASLRLVFATVLIAPIAINYHIKETISLTRKDYFLIIASGFFPCPSLFIMDNLS